MLKFIFVSWKVIILEMMLNACDKISCLKCISVLSPEV